MKTNELRIKANGTDLFEVFDRFSMEKAIENDFGKSLSFTATIGKVNLRSVRIDDFLSTLQCDFKFSGDTRLEIDFENPRSLLCMYSLTGGLNHNFNETGVNEMHLYEFRPEMVLINKKETIRFFFKKGLNYSFFLIYMQEIRYLKERYKERNLSLKHYREFFNFLNKENNNLYVGAPNLRIADYIKKLQQNNTNSMSSHLFFEGVVYIVLSLYIQQFKTDKDSCFENQSSLTKRECMEIQRISEYIIQNPEEVFTVETLCFKTGLSPCKIQEGFKMMHGRTVADFIRNVRVEKAEELISRSDLNISEIVYSVGFTSRSYFAKIFKRKYNCSPKAYQNHKRKVAVTA